MMPSTLRRSTSAKDLDYDPTSRPAGSASRRRIARRSRGSTGRALDQNTLTQMPFASSTRYPEVLSNEKRFAKRRRTTGHAVTKADLLRQSTLTQMPFLGSLSRKDNDDEMSGEDSEEPQPYVSDDDEREAQEETKQLHSRPSTPTTSSPNISVGSRKAFKREVSPDKLVQTRKKTPRTPKQVRILEVPSSQTPPDTPVSNHKPRVTAQQSPLASKVLSTPSLQQSQRVKYEDQSSPVESPNQETPQHKQKMQFQSRDDTQTQRSPATKKCIEDFNSQYEPLPGKAATSHHPQKGRRIVLSSTNVSDMTNASAEICERASEARFDEYVIGDETQEALLLLEPIHEEQDHTAKTRQEIGVSEEDTEARNRSRPKPDLGRSIDIPLDNLIDASARLKNGQLHFDSRSHVVQEGMAVGARRQSLIIPDSQDEEDDDIEDEEYDSTVDMRHGTLPKFKPQRQSPEHEQVGGSAVAASAAVAVSSQHHQTRSNQYDEPLTLPEHTGARQSSPVRPSQATTVPCTPSARRNFTQTASSAVPRANKQSSMMVQSSQEFRPAASSPILGDGPGETVVESPTDRPEVQSSPPVEMMPGRDVMTISQLLPNSLMSDIPAPPRWVESMNDDDFVSMIGGR